MAAEMTGFGLFKRQAQATGNGAFSKSFGSIRSQRRVST